MIRTTYLLLTGTLLAGSWSAASAENGCPTGYTPNAAPTGTPGANQCVPIPGYGGPGGAPTEPQPVWENRWGAIAYDPVTGKVGTSSDMSSKRKAVKAALDHCQSKGGMSCEIQIDYGNQCATIVYGGAGEIVEVAASSAASTGEAEDRSLRNCKKAAGVECKVFYSGCSYPVRIR